MHILTNKVKNLIAKLTFHFNVSVKEIRIASYIFS